MRIKELGLLIGVMLLAIVGLAQPVKVLFVGNSYTGYNNLSQMVYDVALSTGDSLYVDKITPGGFRFLNHAVNSATLNLIADTSWNYVVLQAQSQEPSWPIVQVQADVFPYAQILCDSIRANNSCSKPVFYMTWGRKNGDTFNCPFWPPVCTYEGMDSLLNERYQTMADDNDAFVSPVGAVWKYIRANYPNIELYTQDESHPSPAGSYAAACTFYTIFLRKDPSQINFDAGLTASEAANIRNAAKVVAYDDLLNWNVGKFDPKANFTYAKNQLTVDFSNSSTNSTEYLWFFGDGDSSSLENPQHTYITSGQYFVSLNAIDCGQFDSKLDTVIFSLGINDLEPEEKTKVYPNPAKNFINIEWLGNQVIEVNTIMIFDAVGREVLRKDIQGNPHPINVDTHTFPAGIYYLNLILGDKIKAQSSFEIIK